MIRYLVLVAMAVMFPMTFAFAEVDQKDANEQRNAYNENIVTNSEDVEKWKITADTWLVQEGEWYDWPQLITICWSSSKGLYMWCIGGATSPVRNSDKRGYDYMVDEPVAFGDSEVRFRHYFSKGDLR